MDEKTYYKTPRHRYWKIKTGMATPLGQRVPLEEAIRVTIAWDTPYTFDESKDKIMHSSTLLERLFARSQTVDWILEMIGIDNLRKIYPMHKDSTRYDLRQKIERLL